MVGIGNDPWAGDGVERVPGYKGVITAFDQLPRVKLGLVLLAVFLKLWKGHCVGW